MQILYNGTKMDASSCPWCEEGFVPNMHTSGWVVRCTEKCGFEAVV